MILSGRDALRYFSKPDPGKTGLLIYGFDQMRIEMRRQDVIKALVGPKGEEEMRLTRLDAAEVRKDPARLSDALKARSFFDGPQAVYLASATDTLAKTITAAFDEWQTGDATLVVTAGTLGKGSTLRKLFEGHSNAYAAPIYDDPPSREEIEATLKKAGAGVVEREAMTALTALATELDPGDFRQTVEKLALYKLGDETPVTPQDIEAIAPLSTEAALDDALHVVAEARVGEIGPIMRKLEGQGVNPTTICIGATRHFRTLHAAATHPNGAEAGLMANRPPVFGPRRDRMARQAKRIGTDRLESALSMLLDADLALRSSRPVPARAMLERAFIRIAMLAGR